MTKVTNSLEIGQQIRQRRKEFGLTLKDAAGLEGVGGRFLSELERSKATLQIGLAIEMFIDAVVRETKAMIDQISEALPHSIENFAFLFGDSPVTQRIPLIVRKQLRRMKNQLKD